ncbi:MAG: TIGR00266 family protein [Myxococcota bacterium]|nr:TIGR00266 family protein [Myxococcota bacterium]
MDFEIKHKPDYASLHIKLQSGEQILTEAGAMMGMSPELKMESNLKGGLLSAAKRARGGESMILNTYTATGDGQRLDLAPSAPGDMLHIELAERDIMIQSGSFCASQPSVTIDTKWGGAKTFFGGEGLFMLKASGDGHLWITSYGAIHEVFVDGTYIIDTGHIVAFEDSLSFNVRKVGGLKSLFFSGEGLVCEFSGKGRLWFQTRNPATLAAFAHPYRRVKPKR